MTTTEINIVPGPPLTSRQRLAAWYLRDLRDMGPSHWILHLQCEAWSQLFGVRHLSE